MNLSSINKIKTRYNPEHDIGPDAPVHWSVAELADLVERLVARVETLASKVEELEAVISGEAMN